MHKNNLSNMFYARGKFLLNIHMLCAFLFQQSIHACSLPYCLLQTKILQNISIKLTVTFLLLLVASNQSNVQAKSVQQEALQSATPQAEAVHSANNESQVQSPPLQKKSSANKSIAAENVQGEIIVFLYEDLKRSSPLTVTDMVRNGAISVAEELDLGGVTDFLISNDEMDENQKLLSIRPGQLIRVPIGRESEIIAQLNDNPLVALAIPNRIVRASGAPVSAIQSSPFKPFSLQSASTESMQSMAEDDEQMYDVNDPYYASQWYMDRIQMLQTWALTLEENGSSKQLQEVKVAVIDSGIDHTHPEFAGRLVGGKNYFAPDTQPMDDYGHGSHVAGLIGASVNNGIGIAGVAPWVKIMPYKTLDGDGNGTVSNVTQAIRDATDDGAQIINLSLETAAPDPLMKAAIDYAASKNVVLVASVGNLAPASVRWPAAYDEVIGVAATDDEDQHAAYSCQGTQVEIAAPGGTNAKPIRSTWSSLAECPGSTAMDPAIGAYCYARGTSMSTGLVSGAAAIILGIQPDLSAEEVRAHLIDSATPLLSQKATKIGNGLLNAHDAARHAMVSELRVSTVSNIKVIKEGSSPYLVTITMTNPSIAPIRWNADWLERSWMKSATPLSGELTYENPATLQFMISPTMLEPDFYNSVVNITGDKVDGSQVTHRIAINIVVEAANNTRPRPTPTLTWTPGVSLPVPQATPLAIATPTATPLAVATPTLISEESLAFDVDYNVTELILKRSDEPYELIITINNEEIEEISWQLSLAPSGPQGQNWLSSPEVLTGTVSPQASNQVVLTIDPLRLAAAEYETLLNVSAQGESTTRTQFISTNLSLLIKPGDFEMLLPVIIR